MRNENAQSANIVSSLLIEPITCGLDANVGSGRNSIACRNFNRAASPELTCWLPASCAKSGSGKSHSSSPPDERAAAQTAAPNSRVLVSAFDLREVSDLVRRGNDFR